MKSSNIQTVKLNIINKIGMSEDKSLLQKIWNIISSSEADEYVASDASKKSKSKEFVVPQSHKDEILSRRKTPKNEYISLSSLDQDIKLGF
jgi:hypothetical protein